MSYNMILVLAWIILESRAIDLIGWMPHLKGSPAVSLGNKTMEKYFYFTD